MEFEVRVADQLVPTGGIHMQTKARMTRTGQLHISSRGMNFNENANFLGLILLLYGRGRQPEWLWNTTPVRFGLESLNRRWDQASVRFTQDIPFNVLASAKYAAVKQFISPTTDVWHDIKTWLAQAQAPATGFAAVRGSARHLPHPCDALDFSADADPGSPATWPNRSRDTRNRPDNSTRNKVR
jgi:hypothetical protein